MTFATILLCLPKRHLSNLYFSASAILLQYEDMVMVMVVVM